jgi:hypothetical protein
MRILMIYCFVMSFFIVLPFVSKVLVTRLSHTDSISETYLVQPVSNQINVKIYGKWKMGANWSLQEEKPTIEKQRVN